MKSHANDAQRDAQKESREQDAQVRDRHARDNVLRDIHLKDKDKTKNKADDESLYGKMIKHGLMAITTNALMGAASEGLTAQMLPTDAQSLPDLPDMQGDVIAGPAEGGGFLNRPIAGSMAESSMHQSLEMTYGTDGVSQAASGSGSLTVNGHEIDVAEYIPGSEFAKAATGQHLSAADGVSMLMDQGMSSRERALHLGSGSSDEDEESATSSSSSSGGSGGGDDGHLTERSITMDDLLKQGGKGDHSDDNQTAEGHPKTEAEKIEHKETQEREVQIERENLEIEHRAELREALRTQDLGMAATERTGKHGTLRMETYFEARNPNEDLEQREGEKHVTSALRSPGNATRTDTDQIHFLTVLQEQAKENDKGLSRF